MTSALTERDPLLVSGCDTSQAVTGAQNCRQCVAKPKVIDCRPGPLEIARSTRYAILSGVWTATFLSSLNILPHIRGLASARSKNALQYEATLVATLLSSISSEFGKSNQASWLGTSYLLATCTFTPLYGRLCNVLGRRGANQLAVLSAGFGTLVCGLSQNMEMLIAARFLTGVGGGGIFTTQQIIISDMYNIRSRGLTQGIANVFNGLGMGLGGPVGGFISDRFGWRWAFLIQIPLFGLSLMLTSINLNYLTPGKGKSVKDVLKRIDYGGTATLLASVLAFLTFLSTKYNEGRDWDSPTVYLPLGFSAFFAACFVIFELLIAPEPVLAPFLLHQKIPVLIGIQNFLVAVCNFSVMYFFPMWFETVALTSASMAGAHMLPTSIAMSLGSLFAGYMMHRTGKYKMINLIFGICPFIAAISISTLRADSSWFRQWFSIVPLGFGNAVVLQTTLIALLAHIPHSMMAIGTGFVQLFREIGQVGGVGIASSIFQFYLDRELHRRIHDRPDAEDIIYEIRRRSDLVVKLPPDLQHDARESYAIALRNVFIFAAASTLLAFIVRLPIPEKELEDLREGARRASIPPMVPGAETVQDQVGEEIIEPQNALAFGVDEGDEEEDAECVSAIEGDQRVSLASSPSRRIPVKRRLSMFESSDGGLDLESDAIGGSARSYRI